jgi:hypothetical protein
MKRPPLGVLFLIAKVEAGRMNVMTTDLPGGVKALPVFSFADEARMFLDLGEPRGGWRARATTTGELVSVLLGPYADVGQVLLDPVPGLDVGESASLVGIDREAFVEWLLDRGTPRQSPGSKSAEPAARELSAPLLEGR